MSIKFLQRKHNDEVPFKMALVELIKSNGTELIISTGYIFEFLDENGNEKKNIKYSRINMMEIKDAIIKSLEVNDLNVVIIGGNDKRKKEDFKFFCNEINNYVEDKRRRGLVYNKFNIQYKNVIEYNWHSKVAIKYNRNEENVEISACIVGSSNISNSTMQKEALYWTRECDIFIKKGRMQFFRNTNIEQVNIKNCLKEIDYSIKMINKLVEECNNIQKNNEFIYCRKGEIEERFFIFRNYYNRMLDGKYNDKIKIKIQMMFNLYIEIMRKVELKNKLTKVIDNIKSFNYIDLNGKDLDIISINELELILRRCRKFDIRRIDTLKYLRSLKGDFGMRMYNDYLESLMLSIYNEIRFTEKYLTETINLE